MLRVEWEFTQKEKVDLYIPSFQMTDPGKVRFLETDTKMKIIRRVQIINQ